MIKAKDSRVKLINGRRVACLFVAAASFIHNAFLLSSIWRGDSGECEVKKAINHEDAKNERAAVLNDAISVFDNIG